MGEASAPRRHQGLVQVRLSALMRTLQSDGEGLELLLQEEEGFSSPCEQGGPWLEASAVPAEGPLRPIREGDRE